MPNSPSRISFGLKLALVLIALAAVGLGTRFFLRPTVTVAEVTTGLAANMVSGEVTVRAAKSQSIESEVAGKIRTSELEPGRKVKAGDPLLTLDDADFQAEKKRIENDLKIAIDRKAVAEAPGSLAELDLKTAQESVAYETKRGSTRVVVAQAERNAKALEEAQKQQAIDRAQGIFNLESSRDQKQREIDRTSITANFDGEIARVFAFQGGLIHARAPIAELISTDRVIEATINQDKIGAIRIGQKARIQFLGSTDVHEAVVDKILPTADAETQLMKIELKLVNAPASVLVPGLRGTADITVGEHPNAVLVPSLAVRYGQQVLTVESGRVRSRNIVRGFGNLSTTEVLEGLKAGDLVILDQEVLVREGQAVKVQRP